MYQEVLKILKSKNSDGTNDYHSNDLNILNNAEQVSLNHSPIIGWALTVIQFATYGYDRKDEALESWDLVILLKHQERMSININFPTGFLLKIMVSGNGDLDENNGNIVYTWLSKGNLCLLCNN